MTDLKTIKSALISVFDKDGLDAIALKLKESGITIYSTGGTEVYLKKLGIPVEQVENLTDYPSILGGRVKTLHPKIFGGILGRRTNKEDQVQMAEYEIPEIDLVIVDLYPFESTVASGAGEDDAIEKIDIGGISLIRAAAKNFQDVVIIPSKEQYAPFLKILEESGPKTSLAQRKAFAAAAFNVSSHYDTQIFNWFDGGKSPVFKESISSVKALRYGENPHQAGFFFGHLEEMFTQLNGKELSYNNLLDIDAAVNLMSDFSDGDPSFGILKHNNACGFATRPKLVDAYKAALAADPVSAFGGILISNRAIDDETAIDIHPLFCEVVIAPAFSDNAVKLLCEKQNRILLVQKKVTLPKSQYRSALNGVLVQDKDLSTETRSSFENKASKAPSDKELADLEFANKLVKHTKSNTIVLAKDGQLLASGTGQTSRVDALKQAIFKAQSFGFDLKGAVMASDAFFPFPDCVEIAFNAGIRAVIQPGGSMKDKESIDFCERNGMSMVFTGKRHFKH